ncbi:MAG: chemotaxis protein CheA [Peptococcaceae bacterium]|nr:chemotaxis protein CheA [Peptococcaceae bacterium]
MFSDVELGVFMDELEEKLQILNDGFLQLERGDAGAAVMQEIFRAAHTIKGSSAIMGYDKIVSLAHEMENLFDRLRKHELSVDGRLTDTLFMALDTLKVLKDEITGSQTDVPVDGVIASLGEWAGAAALPPGAAAPRKTGPPGQMASPPLGVDEEVLREAALRGFSAYQVDVAVDRESQMKSVRAYLIMETMEQYGEVLACRPPVEDLQTGRFEGDLSLVILSREDSDRLRNILMTISEVMDARVTPLSAPGEAEKAGAAEGAPCCPDRTGSGENKGEEHKLAKTVRVDVQKLDTLMNLVGELVIDRTRLNRFAEVFETSFGTGELVDTLNEISNHLGQVSNDLQDQIMKARMLPVAQVFNRFPRMVRDIAQKLAKEIDFVVEGKETELDRNVIEVIGDPLIHLIRNAVDHGIEPAAEREAAGKPAAGRLLLKASYQESHIVITVADDGRGIDIAKIRGKAVDTNLVDAAEAARMSEHDLLDLIFRPGFSTSAAVSDLSGRGVGMDVVKTQIEQINGTVEVFTQVGRGSRFVIKLPLTLAIIRALMVAMGEQVLAFPLINVLETIRVARQDIKMIGHDEVIVVRGNILPLLRLAAFFGMEAPEDERAYVVVLGVGERRLGVVVDRLLGEEEIVIKSLGNYLGEVKGLAGATILGDGRVSLIVDVRSIVKDYGIVEMAHAG